MQAGEIDFSLHQNPQTGSGAYPSSYSLHTAVKNEWSYVSSPHMPSLCGRRQFYHIFIVNNLKEYKAGSRLTMFKLSVAAWNQYDAR